MKAIAYALLVAVYILRARCEEQCSLPADCFTKWEEVCGELFPSSLCNVMCPKGCNLGERIRGTGTYTGDSAICRAYVHATGTDGGFVAAMGTEDKRFFIGSSLNGISSESTGARSTSFAFLEEENECGGCQLGEICTDVGDGKKACVLPLDCNANWDNSCEDYNRNGTCLVMCPAGCTRGSSVWGTDIYRTASSICRAAVHSNADLAKGGIVTVVAQGEQASLAGTHRNGVGTMGHYGDIDQSFSIARSSEACGGCEAFETCQDLGDGQFGCVLSLDCRQTWEDSCKVRYGQEKCRVLCPEGCKNGGGIYGSDIYTSNSAVCRAAAHAIPDMKNGGVVNVLSQGQQQGFAGTVRNEIGSGAYYKPKPETFSFVETTSACATAGTPCGPEQTCQDVGDGKLGCVLQLDCRIYWGITCKSHYGDGPCRVICPSGCKSGGGVWGTDIYSNVSAVCRAAVHAVPDLNEGGVVTALPQGEQVHFASTVRNEVTTGRMFKRWPETFSFAEATSACKEAGLNCEPHQTCHVHEDGKKSCVMAVDCYSRWSDTCKFQHGEDNCRVQCPAGCFKGGSVHGSDVYTNTSAVCRAAVHAISGMKSGGLVTATAQGGRLTFPGSVRNDVSSGNFHRKWDESFAFVETTSACAAAGLTCAPHETCVEMGEKEPPVCAMQLDCWVKWADTCKHLYGDKPCPVKCPSGCTRGGGVWGTDVYHNNSAVCRAAIHAIADMKEGGVVTALPQGEQLYLSGMAKNGVSSGRFHRRWPETFSFAETASACDAAGIKCEPFQTCAEDKDGKLGCAMQLDCYAKWTDTCKYHFGQGECKVLCQAGCSRGGGIYGADVYHNGSAVCRAAVHAIASQNEGGVVTAVPQGATNYLAGLVRNGAGSGRNHRGWGETFRFLETTSACAEAGLKCEPFQTCADVGDGKLACALATDCYSNWGQICEHNFGAEACKVMCPEGCSRGGGVVGADVYFNTSSVCRAAVHAISTMSEGGVVTALPQGEQLNFPGIERNGVGSGGYHRRWPKSFSFAEAGKACADAGIKCAPYQSCVEVSEGKLGCVIALDCHVRWAETCKHRFGDEPCSVQCRPGCARGGSVWGSAMYHNHSSVCRAAVHSIGSIQNGGVVTALSQGEQLTFAGTVRNGVSSGGYHRRHAESFSFAEANDACAAAGIKCEPYQTCVNVTEGQLGCALDLDCHVKWADTCKHRFGNDECKVQCRSGCARGGGVWGSAMYHNNSAVCRAAVHSMGGIQKGGVVTALSQGEQRAFSGTVRNGVSTGGYHRRYPESFSFAEANDECAAAGIKCEPYQTCVNVTEGQLGCALDLDCYIKWADTCEHRFGNDECKVNCRAGCARGGSIWGTDIYHNNSAVCRAAAHAIQEVSEGGVVTAKGEGNQVSFAGTVRNSITSHGFHRSWPSAFSFVETTAGCEGCESFQTCKDLGGGNMGCVYELDCYSHWSKTCKHRFGTEPCRVWCRSGCTRGSRVYGTDFYAPYSGICPAGRHVNGQDGGLVTFVAGEEKSSLTGSARNGITSYNAGAQEETFIVQVVAK
ncbi:uncharacterized protein LOC106170475 isoform X2 [Lingula anatina]|uniref:Uncharacterized protein LOC106170475 isoform X1 n=1 Tax=Lingula anatina TaxID=7574 RepID=A0A1S3J658_LINAN|nr:uncharacterized protein LOC106170475 isoform X1 [Lingula anatina]XP_013405793.1 uncharacterized protein LOC106170475 isoform X2 [Lingula anatina]|eukprot:XP_013405792.1 uncharacterized protein LOC106170475 isoform X1 [Lingula anatina]